MEINQISVQLMLQDVNKSDSDELLSKVNTLIEKVDNLTLRDLRSANRILTDILATRAYDNSILENKTERLNENRAERSAQIKKILQNLDYTAFAGRRLRGDLY